MRNRFATRMTRSVDRRKNLIAERVGGWIPLSSDFAPDESLLKTVSERAPAVSALHVLVVDNDMRAADSLELLLHAGGYPETRVAYSAHGALVIAGEFCPSIVLIELDMRDMGSYELGETLRARARRQRVRLIAVTDSREHGNRDSARDAGFERYLLKPITAAGLSDCLTQ